MIGAAQESARLAAGRDPQAEALARHFLVLQHLLDPASADQALAEVLAISPDERLSNLLRAFAMVAHAGRTPLDELGRQVDELERRCSADGYERFILNWAMWLHGLALRDPYWAQRGIDQQYEYLDATGLAETWLTSYSRAVTEMIDGVSGRRQLADALDIAHREGYRIEGDCMLALAYSEACRGEPRHRRRAARPGPHVPLQRHRPPRAPRRRRRPDRAQPARTGRLPPAIARGKARSVEPTLLEYGIRRQHGAK